jgi:hypothetical protein
MKCKVPKPFIWCRIGFGPNLFGEDRVGSPQGPRKMKTSSNWLAILMGPDGGGIQIGLLPYIVQFFMFMGETINTLYWM